MSTDPSGFAFISLLRDELEARGLCGLLESIARPRSGVTSVFLTPEVRGRDFFAAPARQPEVDRWWKRHVPATSVPVYLLCHEEGLSAWRHGLDGVFIVAASRDRAAEYAGWSVIEAEPPEAPLALAGAAVEQFGVPDDPSHPSVADIFDRRDLGLIADLRVDAKLTPDQRPESAVLLHVDGVRMETTASGPRITPDPVDQLAAKSVGAQKALPPDENISQRATPDGKSLRMRARLPLLMRRHGRLGPQRSSNDQR